jgi:hypothetical protein
MPITEHELRIRFASAGAVPPQIARRRALAERAARPLDLLSQPNRVALSDLLGKLADNRPPPIIGEADSTDLDELAKHMQRFLQDVESYVAEILADTKRRTSCLKFDVNVLGILSDMQGDLVGTFRNAADAMREHEREHEADDL